MANQLSKEEINTIFKFVESKNVKYKDVQFEIVDHLASAIEEEQATDPSLSFNSALQRVYGKFPITGFAMMILAKEKALSKYWKKRFFSALLSCFSYPKLILTLIFSSLIFFSLDFGGSQIANYLHIFLIGSIFIVPINLHVKKLSMKEVYEKYLFTNTYIQILYGVLIIIFFIPIEAVFDEGSQLQIAELSNFQCWFLTIYYSITFYLVYAFWFEFPKILKQELANKYSHLNIKVI